MDFPFTQKQISADSFLREFDESVNPDELIWHMDREDRYVTVKSGKNWKLQLDNKVPEQLMEGKTYFIPKFTYHRVIKGDEKLILSIKENKSQGENDKMSLKKEEILWLLENCAAEMPAEKPNCGCGQDPCVTYGAGGEENLTINGKPDHEIEMAHKQLHRAASQAQSLADKMHDMPEENLPGWVQSKITMASEYISKVHAYLDDLLSGNAEESTEITIMKEEMEGEVAKASHDIEIELNISKSDMKKLHDGEKVVLKDTTGTNKFTVTVTAS